MGGEGNQMRCAECGSTDIVLEGQGLWSVDAQSWIIPEPEIEDISGVTYAVDETSLFFCRACGDGVGIII